jgi:hypothetical protein
MYLVQNKLTGTEFADKLKHEICFTGPIIMLFGNVVQVSKGVFESVLHKPINAKTLINLTLPLLNTKNDLL